MSKTMKLERTSVMKAAREKYEGENLEIYVSKLTAKRMTSFCKKVYDQFLANLEKEHPGKNFIIGEASLFKSHITKKIESVLKGELLYFYNSRVLTGI